MTDHNTAALVVFLPAAEITRLSNGFRVRVGNRYAYGGTDLDAVLRWVGRHGQGAE